MLADGISQLAAFFVANIAGRRADELVSSVGFGKFRHIQSDHGLFRLVNSAGQGFGQLGFTDAGGT